MGELARHIQLPTRNLVSVEDARAALVEKEIETRENEERLDRIRREFEAMVEELTAAETKRQVLKQESNEARKVLVLEESIEAAREKRQSIDEGVNEYERAFTGDAADRIWFNGTGDNDAILPHQWQGMMFGAFAKRWILGDGVGLGKTRTTIGWLDLVKAKKVVIVCEANICNQFANEVTELAPHRRMYNLYRRGARAGFKGSATEIRHAMLDEILQLDEAVVVLNFEIWRRDKDVLAKLIEWQADTVIVDEAHNLKSTSTANFTNVKTLIAMDNVCPKCKGKMKGLWEPAGLEQKPKRYIPRPCETCGWKKNDRTPIRYSNRLDENLSTKSVKNLCLTTGTPILNTPMDLFSLLHLCNPAMFATAKSFKDIYLTSSHFTGKLDWMRGALDVLKPLIDGIFLSRTKEDAGVILPEQTHTAIAVPLSKLEYPKQYKAIQDISTTAQLVLESGETMTIMHLIALITRKRQANVWPGGIQIKDTDATSPTFGEIIFDAGEIDESVKMDAILDNIMEQHALGKRQLVYSQFKTGLAEFEARLIARGIRVARFDGDTTPALREEIKTNLDRNKGEEPKWDVVLANYKTGGTGLNFTAVTVTHIMDEEWNPGKRDQAYGRTNRIGQVEESQVFVYRIPGTVDTWMSNTIKRKEDMIDGFNDTMVGENTLKLDLLEALRNGDML